MRKRSLKKLLFKQMRLTETAMRILQKCYADEVHEHETAQDEGTIMRPKTPDPTKAEYLRGFQ